MLELVKGSEGYSTVETRRPAKKNVVSCINTSMEKLGFSERYPPFNMSQKGTLLPLPPSLALRNNNFTQDKLFIFDNHCLSLFGNFWPFWMGSSTFTSVLKPQNGSMYLYRVFSTPSLWGWKKEQKSQLLYLTYFHTPDDSTCIKNTIIIDTYNLKNVAILVILGYF